MTYSPFLGFYTKPIAVIKRELQLRRRKLYEEKHRRDASVLVSLLLVFGLAVSTAVYG